jgi:predicted SAM-dependent methyltransferase
MDSKNIFDGLDTTMNINFGCGSIQPFDWINIDLNPEYKTEHKNLHSIPDNSCDIIVSHATICAIPYLEIKTTLLEFIRVLKPGGVVRISLPDIVSEFDAYKNNNINFFPNSEDSLDRRFSAWLTWYSTSRSLLTDKELEYKLHDSGFKNITKVKYKETILSNEKIYELDTREHEFYFMEAMK